MVSKRGWLLGLGICLGLLGLTIGWAARGAVSGSRSHIPPLKVIGDVSDVLTLRETNKVGKLQKITFQGRRYQAVKLADLIAAAGPLADAKQLYLVGLDGFTAAIRAEEIDDCYISFTAKNGWEAINLDHPNSSDVKLLTEIVVVADGSGKSSTFDVIDPAADLVQITPGQLLTRSLTLYPYAEGEAVAPSGGKDHETRVFTRRLVFKASDLTPLQDGEMLLVMGAKGEYSLVDDSGYFEVRDNQVDYLQPETRTKLQNVRGVIVRPPAASIMDAYYEARHYLESGKVLVVALDGLTYRQYSVAAGNGDAPFLRQAGKPVQACGVYPPESSVSLAALLTGRAPAENGVVAAGDRSLQAPSIFAEADRLQKKAVFLEDAPGLLDTEVQPVFVGDRDFDGSSVDELLEETMARLEGGADLIVVRLGASDESGRRYGAAAGETGRAVSAGDRYLAGIAGRWPGQVIVTGTQGAGSGAAAGFQESFSGEAMFVPYWRLK